MRIALACAFALSSVMMTSGILVGPAAAADCGPGTPAYQLRPGGYCANANSGNSLSGPVNGCVFEYAWPVAYQVPRATGERLIVADTCIVDCGQYTVDYQLDRLAPGDRLHLAQSIPEECIRGE